MKRPLTRVGIGLLVAGAGAVPAAAAAASTPNTQPAQSAHPAKAKPKPKAKAKPAAAQAKLTIGKASASKIAAAGSVKLVHNTKAERAKLRVVVKLVAADGINRYVIKANAKNQFSKHWTTKLHGKAKLIVRAKLGTSYEGSEQTKTLALPNPAPGQPGSTSTVTVTTPGTTTPGETTPGGTSSTAPGSITTTSPTANQIPLDGTFKIGSGSTFEMFTPGKVSPVPPGSLSLTAGSDGGLETFGYQPAPSTAFDANGNALASRIIKPLAFDGKNFSVDTQSTDLQTNSAVPVPQVNVTPSGTISGQISAWDAQWNKQNFNQGTPKPDGSTPSPTTQLSGTYNWQTGAYTLDWQSLIVGGPFANFVGVWHLTGTFDPAQFH